MGKKKIKHLGKKRKSKGIQKIIMKSIIILGTLTSLVALIYLNNTKELYEELNTESSAIEFYINMADEIGDKSVQLSWKELMAIDMVKHQNNLTNIKKKDVIDIGKKFIKNEIDDKGNKIKKVRSFSTVIDEIGFSKEEKKLAKEYLEELKGISLSGDTLKNQDNKISFLKKISKF